MKKKFYKIKKKSLSEQIKINSIIASKKHRLLVWGTLFLMISIFSIVISLILYMFILKTNIQETFNIPFYNKHFITNKIKKQIEMFNWNIKILSVISGIILGMIFGWIVKFKNILNLSIKINKSRSTINAILSFKTDIERKVKIFVKDESPVAPKIIPLLIWKLFWLFKYKKEL